MAVAAGSWGTIGFAKSFLPAGTDPLSVAAVRMAIGGLVLAVVAMRPKAVWGLMRSPGVAGPLAVACLSMAGYQFVYFVAITDAGAAIAAVLSMSSIPVFAGLLCRLRGGSLGRRWWCCTVGAVAGSALLSAHGLRCGQHVLVGVVCALVSGLLFVVFTQASAAVVTRTGAPRAAMAVVFVGAGLVMLPRLAGTQAHWLASTAGVAVAGYLGAVATAGAYLLFGRGLSTVPIPVVSTLVLTEPVVATVLAVTVLGEVLGIAGLVGLAVLGLVLAVTALPARATLRFTSSEPGSASTSADASEVELEPLAGPGRGAVDVAPALIRRAGMSRFDSSSRRLRDCWSLALHPLSPVRPSLPAPRDGEMRP